MNRLYVTHSHTYFGAKLTKYPTRLRREGNIDILIIYDADDYEADPEVDECVSAFYYYNENYTWRDSVPEGTSEPAEHIPTNELKEFKSGNDLPATLETH